MNEEISKIRVRFAPSPTGFQHIGGLRTALYDYLFAKKNGGIFILRIEDTDQKRIIQGAAENIIAFLHEFGLMYDEGPVLENGKIIHKGDFGPYVQSERKEIYQKYSQELLASGKAYRCYCSPERLEKLRGEQLQMKEAPKYGKFCLSLTEEEKKKHEESGTPAVVRLNVSDKRGPIEFEDVIRGKVSISSADLDDFVLMKSDGFPTYHLANVVDDHLMHISHVTRGEEWLPSTPKHIILYEAFGWPRPLFAHFPNILGTDGKKKLSKRDGDVSIGSFVERGYLKEVLINFVALLGWNPGEGKTQEIFSLEELAKVFDLSHVHKSGAVFDIKKLDWMNGEYLKKMSLEELYKKIEELGVLGKKLIQDAPEELKRADYLKKVLAVERGRLFRLTDFGENDPYFFTRTLEYPVELLPWKSNSREFTRSELERALGVLADINEKEWDNRESLEKILLEAAGDKRGDFLWPLRVALTGAERSPSPFEVAWVLGKKITTERLENAILRLS